ncbi:MAG: oligoendopeptidase F [Anaerolineales bacterium]|nr:oligoendopeptidase F [Anaerolineales bacterium]
MLRRWRLDDLFPGLDSAEYLEATNQVEDQMRDFETLRDRLGPGLTHDMFTEALTRYEKLVRLLSRLLNYGFLLIAQDMGSERAQGCWAQVQQIAAQAENRTLFFNTWWKSINEETAEGFAHAAPEFRYWLKSLRQQIPFSLSEAEEKIINIKDSTGSEALLKLYELISGRYEFKLEIKGEVQTFKRYDLNDFIRSSIPEVRTAAYREYLGALEEDKTILGQIYIHRVQDWHRENVLLRGYASPIGVRNLHHDLADEVVEILLEVCRKNTPLFQRYFSLKARALGLERLRRCDLYAPVMASKITYTFEQAVDLVLESFHQFDARFADLARRILNESHLDSEVRVGKRPGAFCAVVEPGLTPWVSLTYEGKLEDLIRLGRELGRGIHALMAAHHNVFTQKAPRILSESASAFCELVILGHLIATTHEPDFRRTLLFKQMDNAYTAIQRQAYFSLFERRVHDCIQEGVTVGELCDIYLDNLAEQFSGSLELSENFRYEWLGISSFYHLPFSTYASAFGRLLVLSIYNRYQLEGEQFKKRYLKILEAGGSDSPANILKHAGIEIASPDFWQSGFDVVAEALEELDAMQRQLQ